MTEYTTIELDLTDEQAVFLLREICRHDLKPSEYLGLIVREYIDSDEALKEAMNAN